MEGIFGAPNTQATRTDHSVVNDNAEPANLEAFLQSLRNRQKRLVVGDVSGPHLAAERLPLSSVTAPKSTCFKSNHSSL